MGLVRLLLALSVVISHSNSIFGVKLVGGPVAVQSFFMISGFYMALVLNEKYYAPGIPLRKSYKLFISNRFLKLFPTYWIVLLLTLGVSIYYAASTNGTDTGRLAAFSRYSGNMDPLTWIFIVFSNAAMFLQDLVLFLGFDPASGSLYFTNNFENSHPAVHEFMLIPQAWSIGIELIFYLLAPFILRKGWKLILGLIILAFVARFICYFNGLDYDPWLTRFFPFELGFFLLGALGYFIYVKLKTGRFGYGIKAFCLFLMLGIIIAYGYLHFDFKIVVYYILFMVMLPFVFEFSKKSKIDRFLGDLSYPVYVCHLFILMIMVRAKVFSFYHLGIYLALFSLLFSVLLQWLIINRIEKYRQKRVNQGK